MVKKNKLFIKANELLTSADFLKLHDSLNRFSVFSAFAIESSELKHNALLKYLLSPFESHGLGDSFLRSFLLELAKSDIWLCRFLIGGTCDLHMAKIKSQFSHPNNKSLMPDLEITLTNQNNANKFQIAVEMKIRAKQGRKQVLKYQQAYPQRATLVYLAPREDEIIGNPWINATYKALVLPAVEQAIKLTEEKSRVELRGLLKNYALLIRSFEEDSDSENIDLIDTLIKNHDLSDLDIDSLRVLSIFWPYVKTFSILRERSVELNKYPMLGQFNDWCAMQGHMLFPSNQSYMRFIPNIARNYRGFLAANRALGAADWIIGDQAALLFEIKRNRAGSGSAPSGGFCVLMLGPLTVSSNDRSILRDKLRELMSASTTKVKSTTSDTFSQIGLIAEQKAGGKISDLFSLCDAWFEKNKNAIEAICREIVNRQNAIICVPRSSTF